MKHVNYESALQVLLLAASFSTNAVMAQSQDKSPTELVRSLALGHPCDSSYTSIGTCNDLSMETASVKALVAQGASALPAIEEALDSVERDGSNSEHSLNLYWLLQAYARIEESAAFPRLWKLSTQPNAENTLGHGPFEAMALALGLTSWVPDSRLPLENLGFQQPRDALDRLIIGWERDDRQWLEGSLGPRSSTALTALVQGKEWATLRGELWPQDSTGHVAVGYRFDAPHLWSAPRMARADSPESLRSSRAPSTVLVDISSERPVLETHFTSRSGVDCGSRRITFMVDTSNVGPGRDALPKFLVNDSDLAGLLRVIGTCAVAQ
jgi:hypothetical protein